MLFRSHVYLVGMEEGLLPHHRAVAADGNAIDEERRLCYVGVTRARDRLTLSMSLTRFKWGKARDTIPSRFLFELQGRADSPQARKALDQSRESVRKTSGRPAAKPPTKAAPAAKPTAKKAAAGKPAAAPAPRPAATPQRRPPPRSTRG